MTKNQNAERDWVEEVGGPAYSSISEMVAAMQADRERLEELEDMADDDDYTMSDEEKEELAELIESVTLDGERVDEDKARERIQDDALSVRIFGERRDGEWEATSYELLLTTGGPAVRIVGEIDRDEASSARLEVQDWGKPWTEYFKVDSDVLLAYASCFYFG